MTLVLVYLFIALGISFVCSILEAVLLSTPMSFISIKVKEGARSSELLQKQKADIDRPISAILSLNTIAHTIGAAGVGAEAGRVFGSEYFAVISAVLTVLILVVSEIIPKTIGANYWRTLALPSARVIRVLIIMCYPLVWFSEFITRIFTRHDNEASISREEVSAMVDVGEREGVIQSSENLIIQNLIKLNKIEVRDVMTPRIVTSTAYEGLTIKEFYDNDSTGPYSRIPLFGEERDFITGYVLYKDVLEALAEDKFETRLSDISRPVMALYEHETVSAAWEKLLASKEHIALVVNEYGSFEGVITMEDVVETILGLEIIDEKDTVEDMQQLARQQWKERKLKYKQHPKTDSH
ncbi:MAG: hemolysin family protein [Rikenellaceae bacterium]